MIYLGIDDTDIIGTPGTNQLARAILERLGDDANGAVIVRHQLFFDPRVPYTSKNGSASIQLPSLGASQCSRLIDKVRDVMRAWFVAGSDPGLSVAAVRASEEVQAFGQRCKCEVVTQEEAREVAKRSAVYLEGLGGTEQGIIGSLAAIGLIADGNDGRVVHLASWPYPDDFSGSHEIGELRTRGIEQVWSVDAEKPVSSGWVDVGKHLRPNVHDGRIVLYVEPTGNAAVPWRALK